MNGFCFECSCPIYRKHEKWCSLRGRDGWGNTGVYLGMMAWIICACGMVWLFAFSGCANTSSSTNGKIIVQPDTVYMGAKGWVISYSPNMPSNPSPDGNGWSFNFPSQDGVHYVMVPYAAKKSHSVLTITYRVTGTKFISVQDGGPATFRPMLERSGDNLTAADQYYRWWAAPVKLVGDGQVHTITYSLGWSGWTDVFGETNQSEFNTTMQNLMGVGITFGGTSDAGHGAYGNGKFECLNYLIQ